MVAPITLNVRHIHGHTFTVEVDHDADTLGLKVVIWEAQHIAIDQQRLVFAGKELDDGSKLSVMGITDGAQIFLVESGLNENENSELSKEEVSLQAPVTAAVVPPAFSPENDDIVQSGSFAVSMPSPNVRYELVGDDEASKERINAVIDLAKYVRIFCIFGFILSLFATVFCCTYSIIGVLIYLLGWIGTRKLNRCLLVFPLIKVFLYGFGGIAYLIYCAVEYDVFEYGHVAWIILAFAFALFVCILLIMVFFSICKLMCRIGKLSCDEWCNARARIIARGCCC